ncbi:unnamed protein product [Oppiella nova]|uniref:Penicillin-binding protein transpeptidase domain-containing protein n=1 Tax=Oppiella nova TaxID=334625 RepID=A0A7R9L978_9ACAR|nr:unnamed protein product [Oppiella nova]CAG2160413.1 unnamed protein product [Oppiella nova]
MAMIAGLPKAPSKYNPVVNPERALERRNWILGRMLQLGYLKQAEYEKAVAEPINLSMPDRGLSNRFPYVGEMVRSELVEKFGEQAIDSGYKVYTTVNSKRQQYAEDAVQKGLEDYDRRHGWRGAEAHDKPLKEFIAYANTYPAEVIKPYYDWSLVTKKLRWSLFGVGVERARQLLMDFGLQEDQIPRNFTIALGTPQVLPVQMATGYAAIANGGYRIQPHFISRIEDAYGKTIYEAAPEYACIPCINQKETVVDTQAITPDDEVIEGANLTVDEVQTPLSKEEQSKYRQAQRILKSQSAFDMANILRDVIVHGTGRAALKIGRDDIGGKTGTTNDAKDAWFAGFNGKLVAIAWVGFDQPSTLGRREYGGIAALPVWTGFMGKALKDTPSAWPVQSLNLHLLHHHVIHQMTLKTYLMKVQINR